MSESRSEDATLAPHEELAELLADLQAWVAWEGLRGASLLPVEPVQPTAPFDAPADRTGAGASARTAQRGGAERPPDRSRGRRASPAPGRTPPKAGPTKRGSPTTGRGGKAEPPARREPTPAAPPRKVALKGAWADLARKDGILGATDESDAAAGASAGASAGADPGAAVGTAAGPDGAASRRAAVEAQRRGLRAAVERAVAADRLGGVREVLGDCTRCRLCEGRRNIVYGVGNPDARLVVLGEAPGGQEDIEGEPFVGPAGALLDRMLQAVLGLERKDVYILNMVKCRPPDNRDPQLDELKACKPFLLAQLASIRPEFVLVMGSVASRTLWGQGITRARGNWQEIRWPGGQARVMPTFHPAYLLRRPEGKRETFEDLKALKAALESPG